MSSIIIIYRPCPIGNTVSYPTITAQYVKFLVYTRLTELKK